MKHCSVDVCVNKHKCRGYCSTHYKQLLKYGLIVPQTSEKHGLSHTTEYRSWGQMKARCYNKKHHAYTNYGGRGIKVCDRWFSSFSSFLKDMGEKPSVKHSIERKDVNGDYTPENCVWASDIEQAINRRNSRPVPGVAQVGKRWRALMRVKGINILDKYFDTYEEACIARKEIERKFGVGS